MRRIHRPLFMRAKPSDLYPLASAIWSVRRCRFSYVGPSLRAQRDGDLAQADFYFTGGVGSLVDIAAIVSWAALGGGSGSAYLVRLYEQLGSANLMIQPTTAYMPRLVNAGAPELIGTAPAWKFDGSNDFLASQYSTGIQPLTSDFAIDARIMTATQGMNETIWDRRSSANTSDAGYLMDIIYAYSSGTLYYNSNGSNFAFGATLSNNTVYDLEGDRVSGSVVAYVNGVASTPCASATNLNSCILNLGNNIQRNAPFSGWMNEVIVYNGIAAHSSAFTPSAAPST